MEKVWYILSINVTTKFNRRRQIDWHGRFFCSPLACLFISFTTKCFTQNSLTSLSCSEKHLPVSRGHLPISYYLLLSGYFLLIKYIWRTHSLSNQEVLPSLVSEYVTVTAIHCTWNSESSKSVFPYSDLNTFQGSDSEKHGYLEQMFYLYS